MVSNSWLSSYVRSPLLHLKGHKNLKTILLTAILLSETPNKGHVDDTHHNKKCVLVFPPVF